MFESLPKPKAVFFGACRWLSVWSHPSRWTNICFFTAHLWKKSVVVVPPTAASTWLESSPSVGGEVETMEPRVCVSAFLRHSRPITNLSCVLSRLVLFIMWIWISMLEKKIKLHPNHFPQRTQNWTDCLNTGPHFMWKTSYNKGSHISIVS